MNTEIMCLQVEKHLTRFSVILNRYSMLLVHCYFSIKDAQTHHYHPL